MSQVSNKLKKPYLKNAYLSPAKPVTSGLLTTIGMNSSKVTVSDKGMNSLLLDGYTKSEPTSHQAHDHVSSELVTPARGDK